MQSNQQTADELHRHYRQLIEIQRRVGIERDITRLPDIVMREVSELLGTDRSTLFSWIGKPCGCAHVLPKGLKAMPSLCRYRWVSSALPLSSAKC